MPVSGAGAQNAVPYQTELKSKSVDMAVRLGPFISNMTFDSTYLDWGLGAKGQKAAPDQAE